MDLSFPSPETIFFIASDILCRLTLSFARSSHSPDALYRPMPSVASVLGSRRGMEQSLPSPERCSLSPDAFCRPTFLVASILGFRRGVWG